MQAVSVRFQAVAPCSSQDMKGRQAEDRAQDSQKTKNMTGRRPRAAPAINHAPRRAHYKQRPAMLKKRVPLHAAPLKDVEEEDALSARDHRSGAALVRYM